MLQTLVILLNLNMKIDITCYEYTLGPDIVEPALCAATPLSFGAFVIFQVETKKIFGVSSDQAYRAGGAVSNQF